MRFRYLIQRRTLKPRSGENNEKKWIVIPSVLALAAIAAVGTAPMWLPVWDQIMPGPKVVVDSAMRKEAVDTLAAKLNDHYIFPDKAKQIAAFLHQRRNEGQYDGITDGEQLAQRLTDDLQSIANDKHMEVVFSPRPVPPDDEGGPPADTQAGWEHRTNFVMRGVLYYLAGRRVEKVDHMGPHIGYLKVTAFPPDFLIARKYAAAMNELADTDGLIVDLRENAGGGSASVALLISYFVDQRTHLSDVWDRTSGTTRQEWTLDKPDGKRYGGRKPVVILTGPGTMSAGEMFAYTMQAMKRATVIGQPTWGGANPSRPYRLGDHFFAMISGRRITNPITHANWEGVGVVPDIAARPDNALIMARELLQRRLQEGVPAATAGH